MVASPYSTEPTSRRRRFWKQCGATVLMSFGVLIPLVLYTPSIAVDYAGFGSRAKDICAEPESLGSFFAPNMLMGNFTLGQAKAIDVGWNVVIGRGGQALMAWSSYGIVMQGLVRIAESIPVSYDLFLALAFRPSQPRSAVSIAHGLGRLSGWRAKFTMGWLLYSFVFMLVMPSIFDASTGYAIQNGLVYYDGSSPNGTYYQPSEKLPSDFTRKYNAGNGSIVYNCLTDSTYQWGFVSGWIFVVFPLWSIWVFGMYVLWMDAQHNSQLTRKGWRLGEWRAMADLAEAMKEDIGPVWTSLSDPEVEKKLRDCPPLVYRVSDDESGAQGIRLCH